MCGIAGVLFGCVRINASDIVTHMAEQLAHRGPDGHGEWVDTSIGIGLAHRRLAVLDISSAGYQPMLSVSGRFVIVFNGEIYNYQDIRKKIEFGYFAPDVWRGHSDTEVILAAIEAWGVEAAVKHFVGMFAIAVWDRQEKKLFLVRDRMGEKPLYYGIIGGDFVFASELKAFRCHPAWKGDINRDAITLFLRHNCIPAPYTIYSEVSKLVPGSILNISKDKVESLTSLKELTPVPYWSARKIAEFGVAHPITGSDREVVEELDSLLRQATLHQMITSDVPLGAFLSGGVDSSLIVALMQAQSGIPVKTFTIGFNEPAFNEAEWAKSVGQHLGTNHTELYVTPKEALAIIPRLPCLYDEPFSDSSQIPTFLISELTRRHVTVSLSGDGGDELFGGYNRYFMGRRILKGIGWVPKKLRALFGNGLTMVSPQTWDTLFNKFHFFVPKEFWYGSPGDKLYKFSEILSFDSPDSMYKMLVSHWKSPASVVIGGVEPPTIITDENSWAKLSDFTLSMMFLDLVSYLPDDNLVKVDRAAMGVSLETRAPFLDHRVVEFAWRIPLFMKIRNGQGKWILRQILYKYVPRKLIERPKVGFGVPIDSWLRGPLREWAEELLNKKRLSDDGFFYPTPIREKWDEHLEGKRNWQYHLWDILMFQAWLDENRKM